MVITRINTLTTVEGNTQQLLHSQKMKQLFAEEFKPFKKQHNDEHCTSASILFLDICLLTQLKFSRGEICGSKAFAMQLITLSKML